MLLILEPIIKIIRAPIDLVWGSINRVRGAKGRVQMDVAQVKGAVGEYGQYSGKAKDAAGKVKTGKAKKGKKKMGLFSKKKDCPKCGKKLHESWDQCPYCNWNAAGAPAPAQAARPAPAPMSAPMPSAGGKQKTVAINVGGGGPSAQGPGIGWLVPLEGEQTGELFQLKPKSVVGTNQGCDVVIRDGSISGRHAEVTLSGPCYKISDLGSTNGTFVNDKRITGATELVDNDNVRLGLINFKFKSLN